MPNLVLTGFSGTGKSVVGPIVARRLGWYFVDLDAVIEERTGRLIPELFAEQGEAEFRRLEHETLEEALRGHGRVVATGGGALVNAQNRARALARGLVIALDARPEIVLQRVGESDRPMLQGGDRAGRIRTLLAQREPAYAEAHARIDTSDATPEEVADAVVDAWQRVVVHLGDRSYPIIVQRGALEDLAHALAESDHSGVAIVTHAPLQAFVKPIVARCQAAGVQVTVSTVPEGEESKSLSRVEGLYEQFQKAGLDRRGCVVALGGGVIGDLAGYAAATYLRGVALYQAPTTLLAQVDSAIGGKAAVNAPAGKNLIGAFHQPRAVYADLATLDTLPPEELRAGLGEVIKYGVLFDPHFVAFLEAEIPALLERDPACLHYAVRRCAAFKARVVEEDEHDETGVRALLNLGHTVGHALEQVLGYGGIRHGEAVAVGMVAACRIAYDKGLLSETDRERIAALIKKAGLPTTVPKVNPDALLAAIRRDKKAVAGTLKMVLPHAIGKASVEEVSEEQVRAGMGDRG